MSTAINYCNDLKETSDLKLKMAENEGSHDQVETTKE